MIQAVTAFLFALVSGCSAPFSSTSGAPGAVPFERLGPEPLLYTFNSGLADSTRAVVRDRDTWADTWAQLHESARPEPPPLVEVDFGQEMVVVVALGTRGSGGYSIRVEDVFDRGEHLEVAVVRGEPGRRCGTTAALTTPADVVRIQRDDRPVRFMERRVVDECE